MSLSPGTCFGFYEIRAPLGEGGMGEVYLARDSKLNRDVAIRILPDAVVHDADRVARFTREAQTLAALNHPNIAQIYGVVEPPPSPESGGSGAHMHALVMELVDGEDLSAIIARYAGSGGLRQGHCGPPELHAKAEDGLHSDRPAGSDAASPHADLGGSRPSCRLT